MDTISNALENPGFAAFKAEKAISFIRPYNPKDVVTIHGYRNAVIRYRDTTKGVAIKPAKVVTIPVISLSDDYLMPETATKVFIGTLEDEQDNLIREAIDKGASLIDWSLVTVDNCLTALTAVRISQRLTKEQIDAWVRVALNGVLSARANEISTNQSHDADKKAQQLALTVNAYATEFSKLSAPVPNLGNEKAVMLKNVLTLSKVDDDISKSLFAKLESILNPEITTANL